MTLPNLILAGAPKCGTSSLYFWLAAHPDVCASKAKETFYFADDINRFNRNCNVHEHDINCYAQQFAHHRGEQVVFEATAPYIYYRKALEEIAKLPDQPKLVFILREPAKRLLSQYLFEKYRTGTKKMSIEEYVRIPSILPHGHYSRYLQSWIEAYGRDRMEILIFEEVMQDNRAAMMQLARLMGIDPDFYRDFNFDVRNETLKMRSTKLHQLGLKVQASIPHSIQKKLLPLYLKLNSGGKPQATEAERAFIQQIKQSEYAGEKAELEKILGREISLWK